MHDAYYICTLTRLKLDIPILSDSDIKKKMDLPVQKSWRKKNYVQIIKKAQTFT